MVVHLWRIPFIKDKHCAGFSKNDRSDNKRHTRAVMLVYAMQAPLYTPEVAPPNDACKLLAA